MIAVPNIDGISVTKEIAELIEATGEHGWHPSKHSQTRLKLVGPNGEGPVFIGSNMKDIRTIKNFRAQLHRLGALGETESPYDESADAVDDAPRYEAPAMDEFLGQVGDALAHYQARIESDGGWQQIAEEQEREALAQKQRADDLEHDLEVVVRQKNEAEAEARRYSLQLSEALRAQHAAEGRASAFEQALAPLRGLLVPTG